MGRLWLEDVAVRCIPEVVEPDWRRPSLPAAWGPYTAFERRIVWDAARWKQKT